MRRITVCVETAEDIPTEKLEELRRQIYEIEKSLSEHGLDPRRGLESYKVSELKAIIFRSQDKEGLKRALLRLVELQEQLYRELYSLAGLKHMNIDTDTPEKRLIGIKEWLTAGRTASVQTPRSRFREALDMIAAALRACDRDCEKEIRGLLQRVYKRDYDRYRVVERILRLCVSYGGTEKEILRDLGSRSLDDLVKKITKCAEKMGREKLVRIMENVEGVRR